MTSASLPDEILHEILSYSLSVPHDEFLRFHDDTSAGWLEQPIHRHAELLLVSKRWLRVGTPLLYRYLRLSTPAHTAAVANLFRAHPEIGRAVRGLRLEGGLGKDLALVAQHLPNLHSLALSLRMKSTVSVAGLKKALPLFSPVHFYLAHGYRRENKKVIEVRKLLFDYIKNKWTSLQSVDLADCFAFGMDGELANALAGSSMKEINCFGTDLMSWLPRWARIILKAPNLQRVICRGKYKEKFIRDSLSEHGNSSEKFCFVSHFMDEILAGLNKRTAESEMFSDFDDEEEAEL
ncbi:hypothetical protein PsYK624_080970 [Phanerochaete sordida]|uniref:F-box domain-containing protein n=1 Tax=Phanerochaete sordida TaxID=48140 RepID=A0A9P3LE64_9APHY|nr:hypothetical protein PsYK624_080970 [Phanerochaete sordida]